MGLDGCGCCGSPYLTSPNRISSICYDKELNCITIQDSSLNLHKIKEDDGLRLSCPITIQEIVERNNKN